MCGFEARIWATSVVKAARIVSGERLLQTSLVPKCIITTSGWVAASQPTSRFWLATLVAR